MSHGRKFEDRVNEVLRGRKFEPKHIHLFARHPKRSRQNIDAEPTTVKEKNGICIFI
jgi:hypothetical protein